MPDHVHAVIVLDGQGQGRTACVRPGNRNMITALQTKNEAWLPKVSCSIGRFHPLFFALRGISYSTLSNIPIATKDTTRLLPP